MRLFFACATAALLAALGTAPVRATTPAPLAGLGAPTVEPAQFRWPWEARQQRRKTRPKRQTRPTKRGDRPAGADRDRRPPPAVQTKRALDPKDALLPALIVPLGFLPRGATAREEENWAAVASQIGEPAPVPLLPPEGPAPAPANVQALMATLNPEDAAPPPALAPAPRVATLPEPDDDEPETPDMHVPLPPVRPGAESAAAPPLPRDVQPPPRAEGLAPEGGGLAPEGGLSAEGVPLPEPRDERRAALEPGVPLPPEAPEPPKGPSEPAIPLPVTTHAEDPACAPLADPNFAAADQIPPIEGPGVCGSGPLVLLTGVKRKDGGLITVKPAATLRCAMAKELADFLRDDLAPAAEAAETKLERLTIAGSFQCRGRNGAAGGKMSEHGRANAVDLSGFGFANGKDFGVFAADLPEPFKTAAKAGACAHFSTVLGPGSDGFHETHLHIDLQPRKSKAKLCQWSDPEVAKAKEEDKQEAESPKGETPKGEATSGEEPERRAEKPRDGETNRRSGDAEEARGAARRKADPADEPLPKREKTP